MTRMMEERWAVRSAIIGNHRSLILDDNFVVPFPFEKAELLEGQLSEAENGQLNLINGALLRHAKEFDVDREKLAFFWDS